MSFVEAVFLGIIQGLTEFLPISSTGHLTISGKILGLISEKNPEQWTAFIAVIQLGTLLAILVYFWKDIWKIFLAFINENFRLRKRISLQTFDSKMGWYILLGTLPVVVVGLGFKDVIEGALTKNLYLIGGSLIVVGFLLAVSEVVAKHIRDIKDVKWYDALIVGIAQTLALIPGSSRSGTTITAGLFLKFKRESAARFSFLLSVPAILGSGIFEFYGSLEYLDSSALFNMIVATISAAVSGYLTIEFLLRFLKKHTTFVFVFYRVLLGLAVILMVYFEFITV